MRRRGECPSTSGPCSPLRLATVIDYLDRHSGASTALLTFALVLVTIYYAAQNWRMVGEMGKTRALAILPKLAVEFRHIGPNTMDVAVRNVGPGPVLAVDVELTFDPADAGAPPHARRYRQNLLVPGEQQVFAPPGQSTRASTRSRRCTERSGSPGR
jgi:hypothetical protein